MDERNISTLIAVLSLVATVLGLMYTVVCSLVGPLPALIVLAFLAEGMTCLWVGWILRRDTR